MNILNADINCTSTTNLYKSVAISLYRVIITNNDKVVYWHEYDTLVIILDILQGRYQVFVGLERGKLGNNKFIYHNFYLLTIFLNFQEF